MSHSEKHRRRPSRLTTLASGLTLFAAQSCSPDKSTASYDSLPRHADVSQDMLSTIETAVSKLVSTDYTIEDPNEIDTHVNTVMKEKREAIELVTGRASGYSQDQLMDVVNCIDVLMRSNEAQISNLSAVYDSNKITRDDPASQELQKQHREESSKLHRRWEALREIRTAVREQSRDIAR